MPTAKKWVNPVFEKQADATINQVNPVSGTLYEVLATTRNVRIELITVKVVWTVQPTPLQIHITIDGNTIIHNQVNPASNQWYRCTKEGGELAAAQPMATDTAVMFSFLYEGRSIRVQAETTGGTVQNLVCYVKYCRNPDV